MATLLIRFHDLFLYVRRKDKNGKPQPDVVLLPSGRGKHVHAASIVGSRLDHKLEQTEVTFCHRVGGKFVPIPGSQNRERAEQPRLVDLTTILGKDGIARPELLTAKDDDFPTSLNARIILPNGRAVAHRARRRDADKVKWAFEKKGELKAIESQELTDTLHIEIDVLPNADLFAVFSKKGMEPVRLEQTFQGNYLVTVHNEDQGCTPGAEVMPGDYTLEEYRFLYELTKADSSLFRFPSGTYGDRTERLGFDPDDPRSKCLPICGGADCPDG